MERGGRPATRFTELVRSPISPGSIEPYQRFRSVRGRTGLKSQRLGNHTFRATGITAYLANGGALEHAQEMAAHESPRTTKLYDRTNERLTQDEVDRIGL
jgi:integrase